MISALKRAYANFRGFDLTHSTVPPMEGSLKPNEALDAAPVAMTLPDVDNLVSTGNGIVCSSGPELLTLEPRPGLDGAAPGLAIVTRKTFPANITCVAEDDQGALAIGLDDGGIVLAGGPHDGKSVGGSQIPCPTAALFLDSHTLIVANGSAEFKASAWKRDLMSGSPSGSVWIIDLNGQAPRRIADGLAFPTGIAANGKEHFFVSEAWRHRIVSIDRRTAEPKEILADLPAYPGRITAAATGGFWLALFAPRNSLVEFVLLEDAYRRRMVEQIDPDYWIAPSLLSGKSFLEPIQGGARKKLNMLKPWSPTWSYGLIARCDAKMRPLASYHSRADGSVHGVTSLCEWQDKLFVGAKGAGVVVALESGAAGGAA